MDIHSVFSGSKYYPQIFTFDTYNWLMAKSEDYILGTDPEELFRLGLQHQVWTQEANTGWNNAGFSAGDTILDLGSGPGFCTKELGFIVGKQGKVIAVDKSQTYMDYVDQIGQQYHLNIETICAEFDELDLPENSIDGLYCRWALAWVGNPNEILQKLKKSLKPGGKLVFHEYTDWMTHRITPSFPHLQKAIEKCFQSFEEFGGTINIGRQLPSILNETGYKVTSVRPMAKISLLNDLTWQWPKSFYETYFPKLIPLGYLTEEEVKQAFEDLKQFENTESAVIACPLMVEVIAEK